MPLENNLNENRNMVLVDIATAETLTIIGGEITLRHQFEQLLVRVTIADSGSVIAFDQFRIRGRFVRGGTLLTMAEAAFGTEPDDISHWVLHTPDDLAALAHDATGIVVLNVKGLWSIDFAAAQAGVTAEEVTRTMEVAGAPIR